MATTDSMVKDGSPGAWPYPKNVGELLVVPTGATTAQTLAAIAAHGLRGTATLATDSIGARLVVTQDITVTGAKVGAEVAVGGPATLEAGLIQTAYVSAADTVTLRTANITAAGVAPAAAQTVSVRVFNPPA